MYSVFFNMVKFFYFSFIFKKNIERFKVGDVIAVKYKISNEINSSCYLIEGVVKKMRSRGIASSFIIQKTIHGILVTQKFLIFSPLIEEVVRVK